MSIDRGGEARLGTNVVSSATSIALTNKDNFTRPSTSGSVSPVAYGKPGAVVRDESFLRIPPFPGSSLTHFVVSTGKKVDVPELASELRNLRVGGAYWAAQPELPGNYVLVRDPAYTVKAADWFPGTNWTPVERPRSTKRRCAASRHSLLRASKILFLAME